MNYYFKYTSLLGFTALATALLSLSCVSFVHAEEASDPLKNFGIGPVKKVELGAIDQKLVAKGKEVFPSKCGACHKMAERYVGPALAGVTKRRSPEWIMNMMLNPQEMIQKDAIAQELFGEFLVPMTFQNLSESDARAVLEYLREQDSH